MSTVSIMMTNAIVKMTNPILLHAHDCSSA